MSINEDGTVTFVCEGDDGLPVTIEAAPLPYGTYQAIPKAQNPTLKTRNAQQPDIQFYRLKVPHAP